MVTDSVTGVALWVPVGIALRRPIQGAGEVCPALPVRDFEPWRGVAGKVQVTIVRCSTRAANPIISYPHLYEE
jgi:hypothetical protein